MALTNNAELAKKLHLLRSHGITRDPTQLVCDSEGAWYYQQIELGYNYRMTDIQAALGVSQLGRLDDFVNRRRALAARYDMLLDDVPVITPAQQPDSVSAYHLYPICIKQDVVKKKRHKVFDAMRTSGIGVNVHYIPVHLQPYYRKLGFNAGDFSVAEQYYVNAISLPLYYSLSDAEQDQVVVSLKGALS